ncbi:MAG: amidohydrolase/deacetylase family metallohydrolase [Bryobacteraceae bacterium]
MDYELVLRNGRVIDPSQGIDRIADVAINSGRIAAIGEISGKGAAEEDLRGQYVCPGLIDLHGHWWEASSWGIDPDIGLNHGVTTAVDAGTTGFIGFPTFRKTQMNAATARVLAFVNISAIGIPTTLVGELEDIRFARPLETARLLAENRDVCLGVKLREGTPTGQNGPEAMTLALEAAQAANLPMMVHITRTADTPTLLRRMRPGDIVTHCFQGRGDGILRPDAALLPEVVDARKRGVLFDVGHGAGAFNWDVARKAFEHFFYPDTISTDLHRYSVARWAYDLPTVMSKFLHLGMPLADVILKSTWAPAQAIGRGDQLGTLRLGAAADLFVFEIEEGSFALEDTHLRTEMAARRIKPRLTVVGGKRIEPGSFPVRLRELYECDYDLFRTVEQSA